MTTMNLTLNTLYNGPVYITLEEIGALIDAEIDALHVDADAYGDIDSEDLLDLGAGCPSEACAVEWSKFEVALEAALKEFAGRCGLVSDWVIEAMASEGPLNVFHTLSGAGISIRDGRWDHLGNFATMTALKDFLAVRLVRFVDCTGAGSLVESMRACAFRDHG